MNSGISIIVPVYNAECTIARCIESIQKQTYSDFRVILVVDGSTDHSSEICHSFAEKDSRICVIDKENGGVSSARNAGLSAVNTEWLTFIDSDDYLTDDAFQLFIENSEGSDLVITGMTETYAGKLGASWSPQKALIRRDAFKLLFTKYGMHTRTSAWGRMFKTEIINNKNLRFDTKVHHAEDLLFLYEYITYCNYISFTGAATYFYCHDNPESLSIRFNSYSNEYAGYCRIREAVSQISMILGNDFECNEKLSWPICFSTWRVLNSIYHRENSSNRKQRLDMIRSLDLDYYRDHSIKSGGWIQAVLDFVLLKKRWLIVYDFIRKLKVSIT